MAQPQRVQILVAIRPRLLGELISDFLAAEGDFDVEWRPLPGPMEEVPEATQAAVVSPCVELDGPPRVVVRLSGSGASISVDGRRDERTINGPDGVRAALARAVKPRRSGGAAAAG